MMIPDSAICYVPGYGETTVGELRAQASGVDRVITTGEAAELFGYSSETWRRWAREIPGAYQDEGEAGYWRLPLTAARQHVARLTKQRRRKRGPWKAEGAQARGIGAEGVPAGTLVFGRSPTVGRRQTDDAEPEGSRLAG